MRRAPNSLHSRASLRAASLSPNHTLGSLVETMEVATPLLSMSSMALLGVHNSSGRWFVFLAANRGDKSRRRKVVVDVDSVAAAAEDVLALAARRRSGKNSGGAKRS